MHLGDHAMEILRRELLNLDKNTPLAVRFRALFSLKIAGSKGSKEAVDIIAKGKGIGALKIGFDDESELLKHELAYVLGQTRNMDAAPHLQSVLKDANQPAMVRHEVRNQKYLLMS